MYIFILLVAALIPAYIAKKKGRNFFNWYFYGVFLWLFALIHSLFLKPIDEVKK